MSDEFETMMTTEFPPVTCIHCGHVGEQGDDHTCPCRFSDADCPDHPVKDWTDHVKWGHW